jgi:hypothetical protein
MLAPSEASNMGSERLTSAQRADAVPLRWPACAFRVFAVPTIIGFNTIVRTPQHDA